jgi:hypothetical protein
MDELAAEFQDGVDTSQVLLTVVLYTARPHDYHKGISGVMHLYPHNFNIL